MFTLSPSTRRLFVAAALAGVAGLASAQGATDYPNRPVTVIVPFAPGGSVDSAARLVLQSLGERTRQNFIIENVAGASGTIGTQRASRAVADGYTLLFAVASSINVAPLVKPSIVRYDALKDFVPVATVANSPFVLIGSPQLQASTTADVLAMARKAPGKLNYGTDGVGTSMHLVAEIIKLSAGVDMLHVPFRNGPQVLTDVAAGRVELAVMPLSLAQPFMADGKVKAYGVTSGQRWAPMPDLPALAETEGLKSVDVDSWYGLLAPAGTDAAIVQKLATELGEVLKDPAMTTKMQAAGLRPQWVEREAFASLLLRERETLAAAVKAAGIQPE